MTNVRKKISELTALTSASLDTTLVGVDNGTTYKIELDTLADAVTSRVNILDRSRLSALETFTSSANNDVLNSYTASQNSLNTAFTNAINGRLQTSSFNSFSSSVHSEIVAATNEQSLTHLVTTSSFNSYTASQSTGSLVSRLDVLESNTGSYLTSLNGTISGSSQLTSSYDERYILSGSIVEMPLGIISGSSQLTSSFDTRYSLSGSNLNLNTSSLATTGSNQFSGSQYISGSVIFNNGTKIYQSDDDIYISSSGEIRVTSNNSNYKFGNDGNFYTSVGGVVFTHDGLINQIPGASGDNINIVVGINDSIVLTTDAGDGDYAWDFDNNGDLTVPGNVYGAPNLATKGGNVFDGNQIITGSLLVSGSTDLTQLTISGDLSVLGNITGSIRATNGLISGSSQLTSSLDLRYLLTGSVTSSINALNTFSASENTKATTLATYTSSLNTWTSSVATTGSNSFNGNQTITGSLNVSSIAVVSSSFTANSSSLTLNSGSNLYIQNNGIVEITGSLLVSGSNNINLVSPVLQIGTGSGDEGGELLLAKAVTNTTLSGTGVTVDVYRDRIRIFEQGGAARGVYIDLAKTPGGVAGELMWKASGIVNAGTFVTLDNIKATLTSSSNRGLSVAAVSTNFSANISAYHAYSGGIAGISANNQSITTTPTTSLFGWNFPAEADGSYYNILDKTNNRFYRITLMIGATFNNNFISIERLY